MLNSGDKDVGVAKFLKLSFRCFTLSYKLAYFFVDMNSLLLLFHPWNFFYLFANFADMLSLLCSIVYQCTMKYRNEPTIACHDVVQCVLH